MHRLAKSAISLFFLLALLYPLTEKTLHELSHANDEFCDDFSQVHLHQEEHHCEVCDFVPEKFMIGVAVNLENMVYSIDRPLIVGWPTLSTIASRFLFGLKAPPIG